RMKAQLTFELVKQFYTDEMVFQITEDPGVVKTVRLSSDHFDSLKESIYDLVAEDTVDHSTSQAEQFETLATTLPQALAHGPQWAKLFIQMSDLRNKDTLVKMIDQMSAPPPVQPKVSIAAQWNELTQAERIAWCQQFGWNELLKAEMQSPTEPASLTQNKAELMKMKMKTEADVQAAMIRAGTEHHN